MLLIIPSVQLSSYLQDVRFPERKSSTLPLAWRRVTDADTHPSTKYSVAAINVATIVPARAIIGVDDMNCRLESPDYKRSTKTEIFVFNFLILGSPKTVISAQTSL